jgi:alkylation response protein AidB-like acyl-CoA dehydrogenase
LHARAPVKTSATARPRSPSTPSRGGNGYTNDYPLGRLLRDAKLYEIGAGTSEIRRMLIGRELFEKSA